jgi:hypothetical protein
MTPRVARAGGEPPAGEDNNPATMPMTGTFISKFRDLEQYSPGYGDAGPASDCRTCPADWRFGKPG